MRKAIVILALLGDPTIPPGLPNSGGFNQTLNNLTLNINHDDFDIIIITDSNGIEKRLSHEVLKNNIEIYRLEISQQEVNNQEKLFQSNNRLLEQTMSIVTSCARDIKLIHTFYWISGYVGKLLSQKLHIPFIHTVISLFMYRKNAGRSIKSDIQFQCEKIFLKNANLILAITEDESRILKEFYDLDDAKIYVTGRNVSNVYTHPAHDKNNIPSSLESSKYFPTCMENMVYLDWWKQQAFLYIGRMVEIKGVDIIIKEWIRLYKIYHGHIPSLWLVGGSLDEINQIRKLCPELKNYEESGKMIWWGYLDASSISTLFLKTCALIVHSNYEPGGRVILEAFSQAIPVISTKCGFGKDYIIDGYNGYTVDYGDGDSLLRCMEYYVNNPYLSDTMGNNAKKYFTRIRDHWDYLRIHAKIYRHFLYDEKLPIRKAQLLPDDLNDDSVFNRLTQFPYPDFSCRIDTIVNEVKSETGIKIEYGKLIKQTNCHYIAYVNNIEYHLHRIYNYLSPSSIWNRFIIAKGNSAPRRLNRIQATFHFNSIRRSIYVSEENFFHFSQYTISPNITLDDCLNIIGDLSRSEYKMPLYTSTTWKKNVRSYQKRNNFAYIPPFSLQIFLEILRYHIAFYNMDFIKKDQLDELTQLVNATNGENPIGINYGTSFRENLVSTSEGLYLLPTDMWYYGELGADVITAILEFDERYLFSHNLSIQGISHKRLILWQSVILLYHIFIDNWNRQTTNEKTICLFEETLSYAFNMK